MFTYFFLYPLPIVMVAFGLKADNVFAKLVGLAGAFFWYSFLGWNGTYIALLVMVMWWFMWTWFKLIFVR